MQEAGFYLINRIQRTVRGRGDLTPLQRYVLLTLAIHKNRETGRCNPRQELLVQEIGCSRSSLNRALRHLEKLGFLVVDSGNSSRSSQYEHTFPEVEHSSAETVPQGDSSPNGDCPTVGHQLSHSETTTVPPEDNDRPTAGHQPFLKPVNEPLKEPGSVDLGKSTPPQTELSFTKKGKGTLGTRIWDAYAAAYQNRYGHKPIFNAKQARLCKQLGERLGEDAIPVAAAYLNHPGEWHVKKGHALGTLLTDAESIHGEWQRKMPITSTKARKHDVAAERFARYQSWADEGNEEGDVIETEAVSVDQEAEHYPGEERQHGLTLEEAKLKYGQQLEDKARRYMDKHPTQWIEDHEYVVSQAQALARRLPDTKRVIVERALEMYEEQRHEQGVA